VSATAPHPQVGEVIAGKFKLVGTLGRGAMGVVFAAQHVATGQKVARRAPT
jgi:serine/threonine-protein kinase